MSSSHSKPVVSIICITFNQAKYIREALEGFVMQKTDFPFEVIIHDDASTDGTTQIIQEFEAAHPGIFKPVYRKVNQYSSGNYEFINELFRSAQGEYIAVCEGDDYWTDPQKLQIQHDFLKAHPELGLCFHPVKVVYEGSDRPDETFPAPREEFTVTDLLKHNYIQTNSVMYRRQSYGHIPSNVIPGDWYMHLYHAQFGGIGFIDRTMAVYRRHAGGVWWNSSQNMDEIWKKHGLAHLALFCELLKLFRDNPTYASIIRHQIEDMLSRLVGVDQKYGTSLTGRALELYPAESSFFVSTLIEAIRNNEAELAKFTAAYRSDHQEMQRLGDELNNALGEIARVKQSKSFLTGYYLLHPQALAKVSARKAKGKAGRGVIHLKDLSEAVRLERVYASSDFLDRPIQRAEGTHTAVVLHLYYPEYWPEFSARFKALSRHPFDLFVTLPESSAGFVPTILAEYPNAYILKTPNRGRDILPFMSAARLIAAAGYEHLLKLHSKKSTHWDGGDQWRNELLDALLPADPAQVDELFAVLNEREAGMVGPAGHYIALPVNYPANKQHLLNIVAETVSPTAAAHIDDHPGDFGFFGGSMFWSRLDALMPLLRQPWGVAKFEGERGQVDGTFAHAIERAIWVVPELTGRKLYSSGTEGVKPVEYGSGAIPEWSDLHPDNQN